MAAPPLSAPFTVLYGPPPDERAPASAAEPDGVLADAIAVMLAELGVEVALGISGGAVAPLLDALARSPLRLYHCRHEGGAAFAAVEACFASGRPTAVFATSGPGILNALTGLYAARWDGARVILVSGATATPQRGRWAFQETSSYTMATGLIGSGALFHYGLVVESPSELPEIGRRLAAGLARPEGFVAHLCVPTALQKAPVARRGHFALSAHSKPTAAPKVIERCVSLLCEGPMVLWVGHGARGAAAEIRALAERTGAPVMSTPRGKGIFPEDHPQYLGVTGFGGHESVVRYLRARRPWRTLVLGSRLGEFTSFWSPDLVPERGFVHVDIDPTVPGVSYPQVETFAVHSDVRAFVASFLAHLPLYPRQAPVPTDCRPAWGAPLSPRPQGAVRPEFLLQEIQRVIVEGSDAPVLTEAGNSFAWGTHALRFRAPGRYRVSTGFGSMGHAVAGVVGAALGRRGKAVALAGDGAMLMNSEVSTAVSHRIPAAWVVLNDGRYGMVDQGMEQLGYQSKDLNIPEVDFVAWARAQGADGVRVQSEAEVAGALQAALCATGPFVVDVIIDRGSLAPIGTRVQNLSQQC